MVARVRAAADTGPGASRADGDAMTHAELVTLEEIVLRTRLEVLAENIAIGAALCVAFEYGMEQEQLWQLYHEHGYRLHSQWRPGCGKPAHV
jgi:hypothetical protein